MKASPQLMTKALGLHNHAIRRAMHSNAGHVLEQEGDSYAIAFYDPMEAVAFCLQVKGDLLDLCEFSCSKGPWGNA